MLAGAPIKKLLSLSQTAASPIGHFLPYSEKIHLTKQKNKK
jgi:hypothetical protein